MTNHLKVQVLWGKTMKQELNNFHLFLLGDRHFFWDSYWNGRLMFGMVLMSISRGIIV